MMTFDDGIIKIYCVKNISKPGDMPVTGLKYKAEEHFKYLELGITRFYQAMQNNQQIDSVIATYHNPFVRINDIVIDENGEQYKIRMLQKAEDDGLSILKMSLERLSEKYEKIAAG
ncbi:MAG: hypothetical protein ACLUFN_07545 [Eubacterium sp.]